MKVHTHTHTYTEYTLVNIYKKKSKKQTSAEAIDFHGQLTPIRHS